MAISAEFPNKKFSAEVSSNETTADGVNVLTFKVAEPFPFLAGQYLWVELIEMNVPDPKGSRRAFSILNTPNSENTVSIVARLSESGYKQNLFSLKAGAEVIIHGPFGSSFTLNAFDGHPPVNCR